jgi:hypothetical protein
MIIELQWFLAYTLMLAMLMQGDWKCKKCGACRCMVIVIVAVADLI